MQDMSATQNSYNTIMDTEKYAKTTLGQGTDVSQTKTGTESFYAKNAGSLRPFSSPVEDPRGMKAGGKPQTQAESEEGEDEESQGEDMNEQLATLFSGSQLSEEFQNKALVIFESAVNQKVAAIQAELEAQAVQVIQEEVETATQELATKLDEYLSYVVEEWVTENKLAVESGIRTEIAESFMAGLRQLFETHYIEVPEDKVDVLDNLYNDNQALETELNEQIEANLELLNAVSVLEAREIFVDVASDMTEVDAEKFATLAENNEFNSPEEFKEKLEVLKENFLKAPVAVQEDIAPTSAQQPLVEDAAMSVYVNALSRHTKK